MENNKPTQITLSKGQGSSSGSEGMQLKLDRPCSCGAGTPITQRAK
jgi:hypothetical protein